MPFDIAGARQSGYSDEQIARFLASKQNFDYDAAIRSGYNPAQIATFLSQKAEKTPAPEVKEPVADTTQTEPEPKTVNPLKRVVGRGAELAGETLEAVKRSADLVPEGAAFGPTSLLAAGVKGIPQIQQWADSLRGWGRDIGYQPSTKIGDIADNPLKVVPFIAERIITSTPDMAYAVAASPLYIATRTNEILNQRLENDNKSLEDATVGDVAAATGAAIVEGYLERFATSRLLKSAEAATRTGRIAKEAGVQAGTEALEEAAAYAGETVGTQQGFDPRQAALQALEGAIVGGGLGGGAQGVREILTRKEPTEISPRESVSILDQQIADNDARVAQLKQQLLVEGANTASEINQMQEEIQKRNAEKKALESIRRDTVEKYSLTDLKKEEKEEKEVTTDSGEVGRIITAKDKPIEVSPKVTLPAEDVLPSTEPIKGLSTIEQRAADLVRSIGDEQQQDQWYETLKETFNLDGKSAGILLSNLKKANIITGKVDKLRTLVAPTTTVTPQPTITPTETAAATTTTTTLPSAPQAQPIPEELYNNAVNVVMSGQVSPTEKKEDGTDFVLASVSTSALGRALNIGMEDADRILGQMQAQGLVGEVMPNGVRPLTDQGLKTFKPTDSSAQIFEAGEGTPSVPLTDPASPIYQKGAEALKEAAMNRKDVNVPAIIKATGLERQQAVELMDAYQQNGVVSKADPKTRKRKYLLELPKRELRPRTTAQKAVAGTGATGTGTVVQKRGTAAAGTTKPPKSAGLGGVGAGVGTTDAGKGRVLPALAPEQRDQYQAAAQALLRAGAISTPDYNRVVADINLAANPVDDAGNPVTPPDLTETSKIVNAAAQRYQQIQAGTAKPIVEEKVELPDEVEERVGKKKERAAVSKQAKQFEKVTKQAAATTGVKAAQEEGAPKEIGGEAAPSVEREARVTGERAELTPEMLKEITTTLEQTTTALEEAPEQTSKELSDDALISAINGKSIVQVLNLVVKTSDSPSYRLIADQLLRTLDYLVSSGLVKEFPIRVVNSLPDGVQGRATLYPQADKDRQPGVLNMGIGIEISKNYTDYKTVLHEIVHSLMSPLVVLGRAARAIGVKNDLVDAVNEYEEVGDYIGNQLKHLANNLPKNNQMRALVQDMLSLNILKRDRNGQLTYEIDEIYTWGLTDPSVQALLRLIPYRRERSAWSKFVSTVMGVIGVKPDFDNAFAQILSVTERMSNTPDAIIELRRSPATMIKIGRVKFDKLIQRGARKVKAAPARRRTRDEIVEQQIKNDQARSGGPKLSFVEGLKKRWDSRLSWQAIVSRMQDYRRPLKDLQDGLEFAGELIRTGKDKNDFYNEMIVGSNRVKQIVVSRVAPLSDKLRDAVLQYSKLTGQTSEKARAYVDQVRKALHEPERRRTKFMLFAPLDNTKKDFQITKPDGTTEQVSAAKLREYVWGLMHSNVKFQNDAQRDAWYQTTVDQYSKLVMDLTDPNNPNNRLDVNGVSLADIMQNTTKLKPGTRSIDINSNQYAVAGTYYPEELKDLRDSYNNEPNPEVKAAIDEVLKAMDDLQNETIKINEEANYWSQGVSNIKRFYNWNHYVPLLGQQEAKVSEEDDALDFNSKRYSSEYRGDIAEGFKGSEKEAQNVLISTETAAIKAALRLGLRDARQALSNAMAQGIIPAKPLGRIKFEDRAKGLDEVKFKENRTHINYNPDGSIDMWEIKDQKYADAIRRPFEAEDDFLKGIALGLSTANRRIASFFTRYNIAFAPYDFFRNVRSYRALFSPKGPAAVAKYNAQVMVDVVRLGLFKGWRISRLYNKGQFAKIEELAKKDPRYYGAAWELLQNGGESVFIQQFAKLKNFEDAVNQYRAAEEKSRGKKALDVITNFMDVYNTGFELTSRVSAYRILKEELLRKDPQLSEEAARISAAAQTKDLQNFESVGSSKLARTLASYYYFYKPGATGAVKSIDVWRKYLLSPEDVLKELPDKIKKDPIALRKAEIQLRKEKYNTFLAQSAMFGWGMMIYMMCASIAGDDELERNVVATDDHSLWTRNIRIPLGMMGLGKPDEFLLIPWGFGFGPSTEALGAQFAAFAMGHVKGSDFMTNTALIAAESYLPLQPAKFNPFDPTQGAQDVSKNLLLGGIYTFTPDLLRLPIEYVSNVNKLGQRILTKTESKYGDAYLNVDRLPEFYNDMAQGIANVGEKMGWDWQGSPETYYFLLNNLVYGLASTAANLYSLALTVTGQKEFEPKRDLFLFTSFFGKRPNPDARQYERVKYEIEKLQDIVKQKEVENITAPSKNSLAKFNVENPEVYGLIEYYKSNVALINELREKRKEVSGEVVPGTADLAERKRLYKYYNDQLNVAKANMVVYYNSMQEAKSKKDSN